VTKSKYLGALIGSTAMASAFMPIPPAGAVLQFSSNINGTLFSCVDQTACDLNPTVGILNVGSQSISGVEIFGTFQTQEIATTAGTINKLDTTSFNIVNTNDTTVPITIAVGGTEFSGPVETYTASGTTNFSSAVGSTFLLSYYADVNNTQGADSPTDTPGTQLENTGVQNVTLTSQAFAFNEAGAFIDANLFSMTLFATTNLVAGGTLTNRTQSLLSEQVASPVSEPGTLGILGASLLGMGVLVNRRNRKHGKQALTA